MQRGLPLRGTEKPEQAWTEHGGGERLTRGRRLHLVQQREELYPLFMEEVNRYRPKLEMVGGLAVGLDGRPGDEVVALAQRGGVDVHVIIHRPVLRRILSATLPRRVGGRPGWRRNGRKHRPPRGDRCDRTPNPGAASRARTASRAAARWSVVHDRAVLAQYTT